ncbi:LAMI_0G09142g1_1 [Lachancea mirantina]|uniref:allantoicase n=1 Tax=Lachancea mirantina TaxID=1230905 RepID=A0A1G4KA77_9SACH|nr:LAMI_0G09142g1_1 [Lachancea mirantina]
MSLASSQEFYTAVSHKFRAADVIGAKLGGKVLACSDEWFADASNLIEPKAPIRDATRFVHAGAWYDGWETRRHNTAEYDWTVIRMGVAAAHLVGCVVDTAFFNGNHAPAISVDALYAPELGTDDQAPAEDDPRWREVIPVTECGPSANHYILRDAQTSDAYTHVKLKMYPDGGIARFRMYGRVIPLPRAAGTPPVDLAAVVNGGVAVAVSDQHFGSADNLLLPGRGHDMSDGWETARSRKPGHVDWVIVELGGKARRVDKVVVDTAHFRGNFPRAVSVHVLEEDSAVPAHDDPRWTPLVLDAATSADREHEFAVGRDVVATHVKLTIIPDGGVKRLRVFAA